MTKHPRYQHTPEALFLHVYVFVDDWLKQNELTLKLPRQRQQVASYSELFTIALVGEMLAQPYESVWYWVFDTATVSSFPTCPSTAATTASSAMPNHYSLPLRLRSHHGRKFTSLTANPYP
jgi:hypothetical protein